MKKCFLFAVLATVSVLSCGKKENINPFDHHDPVDLSFILQAYDWQKDYEEDNKYDILWSKIAPGLPEYDFYLFEDTAFVLRVPEYAHYEQPFLANAEDFYNSCSLGWNLYSNFEVWYRGNTHDILYDDDDVKQAIRNISVNIIRDKDVRKAAQTFKDSLLLLMASTPDEWTEDMNAMGLMASYENAIESKAYQYFDDEETFVNSLDSMIEVAEGLGMDRFQHYLDADEENQLGVILGELAACGSFDEQCSLWRNWANCEKSVIEDDWLIGVGMALMKSGNYSPVLHRVWVTWRALCQSHFYGSSRDSSIPNDFYNEFRKMCYVTCLRQIEKHPDNIFAMNCAAALGGRTNMNRFGQNYFGNEAMIESVIMMPNRYHLDDEEDSEEAEEE